MRSHLDNRKAEFFLGDAVESGQHRPTIPLQWLTTQPIWIEQWPLSHEKLTTLKDLVNEQLAQNHIEPSLSSWNSPVFVIKMSGKWGFLHDLHQVNEVMESMEALQRGMPSPTMIPATWDVCIVDLCCVWLWVGDRHMTQYTKGHQQTACFIVRNLLIQRVQNS